MQSETPERHGGVDSGKVRISREELEGLACKVEGAMDLTEGLGSGVGLAVCKLRETDVLGGEVFRKSRPSSKICFSMTMF